MPEDGVWAVAILSGAISKALMLGPRFSGVRSGSHLPFPTALQGWVIGEEEPLGLAVGVGAGPHGWDSSALHNHSLLCGLQGPVTQAGAGGGRVPGPSET